MTIFLPSLAKACVRTGVSDRSAAVLATSALHDLGLVSLLDRSKVIERSRSAKNAAKLMRNSGKMMMTSLTTLITDSFDPHFGIEKVFFDCRKHNTLTQVLDVDNKYHRKTLTEEHISIIAEPGSSYFTHMTPPSGSSEDISESLVASLKERNVKTENIKVVGCDSRNVNTGHRGRYLSTGRNLRASSAVVGMSAPCQ